MNVHIPEYDQGTWTNHEPRRPRKLLLHAHEINRLIGKTEAERADACAHEAVLQGRQAKVLIGLGRGKKSHDKRQDIAAREAKRDAERAMAAARRGR